MCIRDSYYIVLNDSDTIYDVDISKYLDAILLEEGDKVTIEYTEGNPSTVSKISKSWFKWDALSK